MTLRHQDASVLLPPRLRPPLLGAMLLASTALVPLSAAVSGRGTTRLDAALRHPPLPSWLLRYDVLDAAALLLPLLMPLAAAALSVVCWQGGERRAAVFALVAPAAAVTVTEVLKPLLGRPSESGSGWMFPSGHVTVVAAVAAVGAVLLLPRGGLARRLPAVLLPAAWAVVLGAPAATSLGTVVEQYHYPTDVLGALLVAVVSVLCVAAGLDGRRSTGSSR